MLNNRVLLCCHKGRGEKASKLLGMCFYYYDESVGKRNSNKSTVQFFKGSAAVPIYSAAVAVALFEGSHTTVRRVLNLPRSTSVN